MADQKFTPGPWMKHLSPAIGSDRWSIETDDEADRINIICWVERQDNAEADARLIAKAPELFEVLKKVLASGACAYCGGGRDEHYYPCGISEWQALLRDIENDTPPS